jgi:hypothetical protein
LTDEPLHIAQPPPGSQDQTFSVRRVPVPKETRPPTNSEADTRIIGKSTNPNLAGRICSHSNPPKQTKPPAYPFISPENSKSKPR